MNRNTKMLSLRNINFERRMNRGSLNAALKKGVSTDTISNRQVLCANELNRKRRDEMIQKKNTQISDLLRLSEQQTQRSMEDKIELIDLKSKTVLDMEMEVAARLKDAILGDK